MTSVSEGDLVTLDQYCRRVRHLDLPRRLTPTTRIASHIWIMLQDLRRSRLFPSLRRLTIKGSLSIDDPLVHSLPLLPSSTLSTVVFEGITELGNVHAVIFFSQLLKVKSQSLATLRLRGRVYWGTINILQKFTTLTTLDLCLDEMIFNPQCGLTPRSLLVAISRIANLRKLVLSFTNLISPKKSYHSIDASPSNILPFQRLKTFKITANARRMWIFVEVGLECMPHLIKFSMYFKPSVDKHPENFATLEHCLPAAVARAPLIKWCSLQGPTIRTGSKPEGLFHWKAVEHVHNFKTLKYLRIDFPIMVLDDDQTTAPLPWLFKTSLDCLEELSFRVDMFKQGRRHLKGTNLSLHTLQEIAARCPNVVEIKIYAPLGLLQDSNEVLHGIKKTLKDNRAQYATVTATATNFQHCLKRLIFLAPSSTEQPIECREPCMSSGVLLAEYINFLFPNNSNTWISHSLQRWLYR